MDEPVYFIMSFDIVHYWLDSRGYQWCILWVEGRPYLSCETDV